MRNLLLVILSFGVTILCWGLYGPVLHWGQEGMFVLPEGAAEVAGPQLARLRPFVCVGLAYFGIGVMVPGVLLYLRGEQGHWSTTGIIWSLAGGALGALGALGIIMAFNFGGKPVYVMPLVFGGAPVVNSFLTIVWAKKLREVGPLFLAGLVIVLLGAVTVLTFKPDAKPDAGAASVDGNWAAALLLQIASILTVVACWGAYGPVLHKGQAAMQNSRLRSLICVGLAYFGIAVVVPYLLLASGSFTEYSEFTAGGTFWSLAAGAAGALGALGIIMAFNFGGKPVFVMPLVFGGAPVVNAFVTIYLAKRLRDVGPVFLAGLFMVALGAVVVLIFKPSLETAHAQAELTWPELAWQIAWIAITIVCWGVYGPLLHKGQAAMDNSRLRPLICVGVAYFFVAVVVPIIVLSAVGENSSFTVDGTLWSLAAGAAGAFGSLGVIMAFNFGGKPIYVMPLIFGGAPVVNSFWTIIAAGKINDVPPFFLAGLILVIAGSVLVLVFAPRGPAKKTPDAKMIDKAKRQKKEQEPPEPSPPAESTKPADPPSGEQKHASV